MKGNSNALKNDTKRVTAVAEPMELSSGYRDISARTADIHS